MMAGLRVRPYLSFSSSRTGDSTDRRTRGLMSDAGGIDGAGHADVYKGRNRKSHESARAPVVTDLQK